MFSDSGYRNAHDPFEGIETKSGSFAKTITLPFDRNAHDPFEGIETRRESILPL